MATLANASEHYIIVAIESAMIIFVYSSILSRALVNEITKLEAEKIVKVGEEICV